MRLTNIINKITIERVIIKYDSTGRPIYQDVEILTPIEAEVEPFTEKLAETVIGTTVAVTNRCFVRLNHGLVVADKVKYKNKNFQVTFILEYDKHNEILIKEV